MCFTEMLTDKKRVKWVFILTLISCFVTLFVSYSSWIIKGCRVFMPFISDMDLYQPEDTIFSAGGTLAGLFVLITLSDICWIKRSEIKRYSLSNFVNFMNYEGWEWGKITAGSVLIMLPVIIFSILVRSYLIKGLTAGAIN